MLHWELSRQGRKRRMD